MHLKPLLHFKGTVMDYTILINAQASLYWDALCEVYPKLCKYDAPYIDITGRYTASLARCAYWRNEIMVSRQRIEYNPSGMMGEVLMHELCHQVDHFLNNGCINGDGHGETWIAIMQSIGLEPKKSYFVG